MKSIDEQLSKLGSDIRALDYFAIFLIAIILFTLFDSTFGDNQGEPFSHIETLGLLISALLVSKVASRQLMFQELTIKSQQATRLVNITHRLLVIIRDMVQKLEAVQASLAKGTASPTMIIELYSDVADNHKNLLERDGYEFLTPKSIDLIFEISGSIFGMRLANEQILKPLVTSGLSTLPAKGSVNDGVISPIKAVIEELHELDAEIRMIRSCIDNT